MWLIDNSRYCQCRAKLAVHSLDFVHNCLLGVSAVVVCIAWVQTNVALERCLMLEL